MNEKYIFFDLDGTLTDPGLGITNSIMYALKKMGYEVPPRESLYKFIGPPLIPSFMKYFNMSGPEAQRALETYREYFGVKGLLENTVYNGIPELLETLNMAGHKAVLATSKPEKYAVEILKSFSLYDFFAFVSGNTMEETRHEKADLLSYAFSELGLTEADKARSIMVGDRENDITGAHSFGIKAVGVLYGYGSRSELEAAGADMFAESVDRLEKTLKEWCEI